MATDRDILKLQQKGALVTTDVTDAGAAIRDAHSRQVVWPKAGTENADTNVAETLMFSVVRASKPTCRYVGNTTSAANATHYTLLTVIKRTAGVYAGIVASWNTHTSAQGAITGNVPFLLVANATQTLAVGDTLHYKKLTVANGANIGVGSFTIDLEEI